jgi:hypothetical protein
MGRNYENEAAWAKKKYTRLLANIDKNTAETFKLKLSENNITYSQWLKERIAEYISDKTLV